MDLRNIDQEGLTICPNCLRHYKPDLPARDPSRLIQEQYPSAKPYQREQLITGLCSDKCYCEYLGIRSIPRKKH